MYHLKDYLRTLEICRKKLPPESNHIQWLRKIERFVRREFADTDKHRLAEAKVLEWHRLEAIMPILESRRKVLPPATNSIHHQQSHESGCFVRCALADSVRRRPTEAKVFEPWYHLEDYLPTFEICRSMLSSMANYVHHQQLEEIEGFVRRALANNNKRRLLTAEAWCANDALGG